MPVELLGRRAFLRHTSFSGSGFSPRSDAPSFWPRRAARSRVALSHAVSTLRYLAQRMPQEALRLSNSWQSAQEALHGRAHNLRAMSPLAFTLARYAAAVSATAIALALRAVATPLWGVALPFIFFYPAIMLSAWLGGFGPGVVATFLCAAAAVSPSLSPGFGLRADNLADATALLVFMGIGLLISGLTGALRRARARLAAQVRRLEADTEALRHGEAAQARLAAIVQSSDDAIVSKTLDGEIMSWNAAATRMFGYAPEEVIGRSITIIIPKDRLNEEAQTLASIRQGKAIKFPRTVRLRKDHTPIWISLTVSPIRNAAGQIIGASKIARDITAQVESEDERAMLLARERTARREAESANRAKD